MKAKANHKRWLLCVLFILAAKQIGVAHIPPPDALDQVTIIYVDDDADGLNVGTSWGNAINSLQDALLLAYFSDKPVEIRVAEGVYTPDQGIGIMPGDSSASFQLINGVTIKGGYFVDQTALRGQADIRDINQYESVLSGDLNADDSSSLTTIEDNSFHVITSSENDATAVLDGFTISGSSFVSDRNSDNHSSGIYTYKSSPTLIDCNFTGNMAAERGAGMYNASSNPVLLNCTFNGNNAPEGGAGIYNVNSSPILTNCTFSRNSVGGSGAGMYNVNSNPVLQNCIFTSNYAGMNGGGMYNERSLLTLTNCTFIDNSAGDDGGAIYSGLSDISLSDCIFEENRSEDDGGGLSHVNGNIQLTGCKFVSNMTLPPYRTAHSNNSGGAILVSITSGNQAVATDCLFRNNSAVSGGAIQGNLTALRSCRFTGNVAYYRGGAIDGRGTLTCENCLFEGNKAMEHVAVARCLGALLFTNCTIVENRSPDGYTFLASGGHGAPQDNVFTNCIIRGSDPIFRPGRSWLSKTLITYCNIQGGWPGEGNIDLDPSFAQPGYWDPNGTPDDPNDDFWVDGDYHLKSEAGRWDPVSESWVIDDVTSPCIDAGDPNSPIGHEPFPNGGIVNMGAYGGTAEASKSPSGIQAKYGGGTGEFKDPYLIYTAEHMNTIGVESNDWDKHFKLMADIDLKDFGDSSFNLIGSDSQPFLGVFEGNGHSISNLTYAVTGNEEQTDDAIIANFGLFRSINDPNAMIRDLRLVNPDIGPASTCTKRVWHAGALVGSLGSGTVSHCKVEGGQVQGESRTGGLAGLNYGTISDSYTICRVQQAEQRSLESANESLDRSEFFGGLVGVNLGEISNCNAVGEISGERKIGGLVGEDYGIISNSWSGSDVSGELDIGGLVGKNRDTSVLTNCYAAGRVSGTKSVGGFIGYCKGSIFDCYVTGSVSAEQWCGGFAGINEGIITSCYSIASVSVDSDTAGGLVGFNGGTILTCLARGDVTGEQNIGGLVGENKKWYQMVAGIPIEYDGVVLDSYSKGSVYGKYGVGGLIGTNTGTVLKCYSIGEVTGERNFGGLVGINGEIFVLGSFWDTETSGQTTSDGGTGKTTAEMQTASIFLEAGWDFVGETANGMEDIWWILEGQDYPRLWWELADDGK